MTCKLKRLKDEMRERGNSRPEDEEIISALKEQVRSSYLPFSILQYCIS